MDTTDGNLDRTSNFTLHVGSELGRRITAVLDTFDSRKNAAIAAGVHVDSLHRYQRGKQPTFEAMAKLCAAKGVSLDWLATGTGPMYVAERSQPINLMEPAKNWPSKLEQPVDTLARIIATVDQLVIDLGIKANTQLKAQMVAAIYQNASEYGSIEPVVQKLRLTLGALQAKSG